MNNQIVTERTNLFEPNDAIGIVFTIRGEVTESQIQKAFETVIYKNETLHSKIVLSEGGDVWYEKIAISQNTMYPMDENWEKTLASQQKILFQIDRGELLRGFYRLFHGGGEVLFLAHHFAGDGKSMVSLVEQFMEVLRGLEETESGGIQGELEGLVDSGDQENRLVQGQNPLPYRALKTITIEGMPGKIQNFIRIGLYLKYYNWRWKKSGTTFTMEDRKKVHEQYWKEREIVLCKETFTKAELQHVITKAKEANVSVSSYMLTAFAKEAGEKVVIGYAIDGRKEKDWNMGNQTCGTEFSFDYGKCRGNQAARLHRRMHGKMASSSKTFFVLYFMGKLRGSLVDSFYMQLFGDFDHKITKKLAKVCGYLDCKRYYSFSNLTKLDCRTQYGSFGLEQFWFVPPCISYGKRLIGVATLGDEMRVTYQIKKDENTNQEIERFNNIMRELKG